MHTRLGILAIILKLVQGLGGFALTPLIICKLTQDEQGYYYTFLSLIALQVFAEMGLTGVLMQNVAHVAVHLSLQKNGKYFSWYGEEAYKKKLASIIRFSVKWYSVASIFAVLALVGLGFVFFNKISSNFEYNVNWKYPWIVLSIMTGFSVFSLGLMAVLEGFGLIEKSILLRLVASLLGFLLSAMALFFGFGLWAPVANMVCVPMVLIIGGILFLRPQIQACLKTAQVSKFDWKKEIWPLQWKTAISWIAGWFIFQSMTPAIMKFEGPLYAGKFGLALQITNGILGISCAWAQIRLPVWGRMVSSCKWNDLKKDFRTTSFYAITTSLLLSTCFLLLYNFFCIYQQNLIAKLPSKVIIYSLVSASIINVWVYLISGYLRAFKTEPFVKSSLLFASLMILLISICTQNTSRNLAISYLLLTLVVGGLYGSIKWLKNHK